MVKTLTETASRALQEGDRLAVRSSRSPLGRQLWAVDFDPERGDGVQALVAASPRSRAASVSRSSTADWKPSLMPQPTSTGRTSDTAPGDEVAEVTLLRVRRAEASPGGAVRRASRRRARRG